MKTKEQKSKHQTPNTNKGITLIALVITIIVLLILAGVAISMAINGDGLFSKANEAAEKWNTSVTNESETVQNLLNKLEVYKKVVGSSDDWEVEGSTIVAYKGDKATYTNIVIPNYVDDVAVDTIGDNLFASDSYATSLTISEGIKVIGAQAFAGCGNIKNNLVIPNSVTTIGMNAFTVCGFTGVLVIPDNVTTIGSSAFSSNTGLTALTIGKNVGTIEMTAFAGCSNLSGDLVLPDNIKTIGNSAFGGCTGLNSIKVPLNITSVGNSAFYNVKQVYYSGSLDTSSWGATKIN